MFNYVQDYFIFSVKVFAIVVLFIFLALTFLQMGDPATNPIVAIQSRTGCLYTISVSFYLLGNNLSSTIILPEKHIYE